VPQAPAPPPPRPRPGAPRGRHAEHPPKPEPGQGRREPPEVGEDQASRGLQQPPGRGRGRGDRLRRVGRGVQVRGPGHQRLHLEGGVYGYWWPRRSLRRHRHQAQGCGRRISLTDWCKAYDRMDKDKKLKLSRCRSRRAAAPARRGERVAGGGAAREHAIVDVGSCQSPESLLWRALH
ncbi:unnamed protein product, partial [Prorocentrum cordatum]